MWRSERRRCGEGGKESEELTLHLAHSTLVGAEHHGALQLVAEDVELLGAEHGLDEREDALAGRGAWQDGEGDARRVGPVGDLALVELPQDEHVSPRG